MAETKKRKAAVITDDNMLFQKIKLELFDVCDTVMLSESEEARGFDIVFRDADYLKEDGRGFIMTREKNAPCDLPLPFRIGEALSLAVGLNAGGLSLDKGERTATLHGQKIRLTEVEFALLLAIYSRGGEYVGRAELLSEVWNDEADSGIINVYVHYLREKLEIDGEKIILSSRNFGYKIDEKYLTGGGV